MIISDNFQLVSVDLAADLFSDLHGILVHIAYNDFIIFFRFNAAGKIIVIAVGQNRTVSIFILTGFIIDIDV